MIEVFVLYCTPLFYILESNIVFLLHIQKTKMFITSSLFLCVLNQSHSDTFSKEFNLIDQKTLILRIMLDLI